jgi:hypothetical protein
MMLAHSSHESKETLVPNRCLPPPCLCGEAEEDWDGEHNGRLVEQAETFGARNCGSDFVGRMDGSV